MFSDVRDIHDILEITVYDEDKEHKYEFLGKVSLATSEKKLSDFGFGDHDSTDEDQERREEVVQAER